MFGGDAWLDVAGVDGGFVAAGVSRLGDGEHAFAVSLAPGAAPRLIARRALDDDAVDGHRRAGPAVAARGTSVALALSDGRRRLQLARFESTGDGPLRFAPVAEGASLQFPPSLDWSGQDLLAAWTDQETGRRRVFARALRATGRSPAAVDVTPSSGGAAAPSFVAGADPPVLAFVDAREAMSVVHRVAFEDGAFGAPEVARPVSLLTDPPVLAAVDMHQTEWVAYSGIGSAATTAVGLMPLIGSNAPVPVVPGQGYGVLHLDAAPFAGGAVIAADVPLARTPDSDREVHLRPVDASGQLDDPVAIRGPRGTASRARVAVSAGVIAVAFVESDGAYVALARCASP